MYHCAACGWQHRRREMVRLTKRQKDVLAADWQEFTRVAAVARRHGCSLHLLSGLRPSSSLVFATDEDCAFEGTLMDASPSHLR
jgi:hypothetical protein